MIALLSSVASAREDTLSFFQYATPIELPSVNTLKLAELILTEPMYNTLRYDLADLRIVQNSNNGAVPVKIMRMKGSQDSEDILASRDFTRLVEIPSVLNKRYSGNFVLLFEAGRFPLSQINLSLNGDGFHSEYLLLGQSSTHAAGSGWRLLTRGTLSRSGGGKQSAKITFSETSSSQYAVVLDEGITERLCAIESVSGPQYCVCFQIVPGESYTLLSGYPDASPDSGGNSVAIDRIIEKGIKSVSVTIGALSENPDWEQLGFASMFKGKMFILPVAVAVGLILALLVFVFIYSFVNRSRPVKINKRPRFHVE
ncbi:MAG: hypothetical protein PF904_02165 [Kiritimatiellae bacterium]|nr:hypothetical protein [Kiritimatiellia bacterium]